MRGKIFGASIALLSLTGCFGPNGAERLADRVTTAIIANDMRPVEKNFNALVRPKLENRQAVGRLSDQLNRLGRFRGVHEKTPRGAPPGTHVFEADFEKEKWVEDMSIDQDGKVAGFHVHRSTVAQGSAN